MLIINLQNGLNDNNMDCIFEPALAGFELARHRFQSVAEMNLPNTIGLNESILLK